MLNKKFSPERQSAFEARFEAQKIAYGPVVFQCVRYAWKRGMLQAIADAGEAGLSVDELAATGNWTPYVLKVVLETCLSAGVVLLNDGRYALDKAGFVVLTDPITQVNIDFNHDVCYQAMFSLEQTLDEEKPLGLKVFGEWPTIYEGLSQLPEPARTSWFAFDHYYSDTSFPDILPDVFATAPRRVMDIGANTGKFTLAALAANDSIELHLVDLPGQLAVADKNLQEAGLRERATLHPTNLLDKAAALPAEMDVIWMSQFLSCFSEEAIASILERAAAALGPRGQVLIMDTFWDRQRYDIASYCLINTSPYFNNLASGNSKVYESGDYIRLAKAAGLELVTARDNIGYCHSLLRFAKVA
ncbi:MAG: class I SAM-dependent methyltransferase [Pseudomonadota bacterium]